MDDKIRYVIGELPERIEEPIPGKRFCVAKHVAIDSWADDFGRAERIYYLHTNGRWMTYCWNYGKKTHGYYATHQLAQAALDKYLESQKGNANEPD